MDPDPDPATQINANPGGSDLNYTYKHKAGI